MDSAILYEFPHSHFCEKARWALDYKQLAYQRKSLVPPWHIAVTRRYGKRTYVPLLVSGKTVVQGSSEIINYLEDHFPEHNLTVGSRADVVNREKQLDRDLGVPLRVFCYQYLLPHRKLVVDAFMQHSGLPTRILFNLTYPGVARIIRHSYGINEQSAIKAADQLLAGMDRLHQEKGNKPYFSGDQFSRIDITVAALLAFVSRPGNHPMDWPPMPDEPALVEFDAKVRQHPLCQWINDLYQSHR